MVCTIEEFIEKTNAAKSREEIFEHYRTTLEALGFDRIVYTFITDHPSCQQLAGHGVQNNFPEEWMNYYVEQEYEKIDPVTHYAFKTSRPFTWADLKKVPVLNKKQINILNEAEDAGLKEGVGVPLYGPNGEMAGVGLASSTEGISPDKNMLCKLKALTEQFHLAYCTNSGLQKVIEVPKLTKKELEVLKWLARGKSADDIGAILHCSAAVVRFHVGNIYKKLDANDRVLAVMKAVHMGIITLEVIIPSILD